MYQSYETTQSPIAYGSPGQQSASSSVLSRIQKPTTTSPTPQAWAIGRQVRILVFCFLIFKKKKKCQVTHNFSAFFQQPVTEGYQYSQLSPSRSPSGPTYTQLSSGARTTTQQYHPVTTVPNNPSKGCFTCCALSFSRTIADNHRQLYVRRRYVGLAKSTASDAATGRTDGCSSGRAGTTTAS